MNPKTRVTNIYPRSDFGHFRCPVNGLDQSRESVYASSSDDDDQPLMASIIQGAEDELFSTVLDAVRCLPTDKQAAILLDTSLALIGAGRCGVFSVVSSSGLNLRP